MNESLFWFLFGLGNGVWVGSAITYERLKKRWKDE